MARFLSPEWLGELDDAARRAQGDQLPPGEVRLVVGQRVRRAPDDEVAYALRLEHGTVRVVPGPAEDADVTLVQDLDTATAVAQGRLSAQAAFMTGRLRVEGDVSVLLAHQDVVAAVDGALAPVRATTTYPDPDPPT
jgi:predicted lipid carrier protein YhbT